MNRSQGRPRRTQREQTLSFNATMHDFSKWSGLVVLQPKQKNITGNFFFKNNTGSEKTIIVLPVDHDQKWMNQEK